MNNQEEQVRDVIAHQAAEWFIRHRSEELDASDRSAFEAWLAMSPIHVEEYLGVAHLTQDLSTSAAALESATSLEQILEKARQDDFPVTLRDSFLIRQPAEKYRNVRVIRHTIAALAAMLAVAGIALWWTTNNRTTVERFATNHGEQRSWQLADRSVLRLNTDSVVTVRYSRRLREVEIERGQVYFEVAHDAARSFQVDAGAARVAAIGTKFDVYRKDPMTIVTVVEGQVIAGAWGESVRAHAGEQVRAADGSLPILASVDVDRTTGWLRRRMAFNDALLGEVVTEFNRYSQVPIEVESPAISALRVSGVLSIDDTPSFVRFLESVSNVAVDISASSIRVHERNAELHRR